MRSECGARARSRKPCELLSKQTLSYKTPLDCSTKNQWLSCVLQNAAAVILTAAPVIGIPQNEGRRRAFTPATGPTSLTWQVRAQVRPHKTSRKESLLRTQVACSVGETPSRGALQTTALLDDPIRQSVRLFGCDRWHDRSWDCHGAGP